MKSLFNLLLIGTLTLFSNTLIAQSSGAKATTWGDSYLDQTPEEYYTLLEEETIDLATPQIKNAEVLKTTDKDQQTKTYLIKSSRRKIQNTDNYKLKKALHKLDPHKSKVDSSNFLLLGFLALVVSILFFLVYTPLGIILTLVGLILILWWMIDQVS